MNQNVRRWRRLRSEAVGPDLRACEGPVKSRITLNPDPELQGLPLPRGSKPLGFQHQFC